MINVAYCDISNLDLDKSYNLLSKSRKEKVDNFRFIKDKKLSSGAYLLLKKLLEKEGISNPIFKFGKYGKAYIANYENIHFNLSHSSKMVACAISDMKVGIDIEYNDPKIDLDIAKNYFFNQEYKNIINSANPSNEFFNYWVLKESYMKYTGLGFHLKLDSFEIKIEDEIKLKNDIENIKFSLTDIDDYKLAVASRYNVNKVNEYKVSNGIDLIL